MLAPKIGRSNSLFSTQIKLRQELSEKNKEKNLKESDKKLDKAKEEDIKIFIKKMISINLSELKESIHKEYLQFQHRINDSIQSYSQNLKNISTSEKRLIEQYADIKIKAEKIELFSDKLTKIDDRLTVCEIRFNNLLRDFKQAVDKYDSLFLDNMSIPGIIGKFCKYKNIKEFLYYAYNKFNTFDLKRESDVAQMKYSQEKMQKFMKKINCEMDIIREESIQITTKKAGFLEKRINEEINEINKKIELIPNSILSNDIEKRISDLLDNYNEMKDLKNGIYERLNNIENVLQIIINNKSPINKEFSDKKGTKVTFSNFAGLKLNTIKKTGEGESEAKNNSNLNSLFSKKIQKYHSLNINKSTFYKDNNNGKENNNNEQNIDINLDNIYEDKNENNDNNDITPMSNRLIKSINFASHRFRENNTAENSSRKENLRSSKSSKNIRNKDKKPLQNLIAINPKIEINDSSDDDEKKQKIEEIIVNNLQEAKKQKEKEKDKEKDNLIIFKEMEQISFGDKNEEYLLHSKRQLRKSFHKSNKKHMKNKNKNKLRNSHTFPRIRNETSNKRKSNSSLFKSRIKSEKIMTNEKIKNKYDMKNKITKKNKSMETPIILINESVNKDNKNKKEIVMNRNFTTFNKNIIKNNNKKNENIKIDNMKSDNNIVINNDIYIIKNNDEKNKNHKNYGSKNNSIIKNYSFKNNINANTIDYNSKNVIKEKEKEKDNKQTNLPNIEIFNNNSIKNYLNKEPIANNKKTIIKNKSFNCPKKNNNYTTSISVGNITDISSNNNLHFTNHEINKKNKELPNRSGIYNLSKLEALKKEEFLKNNKQTKSNPKEIPFITNFSFQTQSHSLSKKHFKKEKIFSHSKDKYKFNGKNKEKNINLELKIIPANFKISKKIQVNLSDD